MPYWSHFITMSVLSVSHLMSLVWLETPTLVNVFCLMVTPNLFLLLLFLKNEQETYWCVFHSPTICLLSPFGGAPWTTPHTYIFVFGCSSQNAAAEPCEVMMLHYDIITEVSAAVASLWVVSVQLLRFKPDTKHKHILQLRQLFRNTLSVVSSGQ